MHSKALSTHISPASDFMNALFEESPVCMAIVKYNLDIICVNKAFVRLLGYSKEAMSGLKPPCTHIRTG